MKTATIILGLPLIIYAHLFSSFYEPTKCILPPTVWSPVYIQAHNPELDQWRQQLDINITSEWLGNENIQRKELVRKDLSKSYKCFQYAIETITGFNGYIELPDDPRNASILLEKYFEQVKTIQKNDLIIYTTSEKDRTIHHFAAAINSIRFKSKCGSYRQIFEHAPFHILYSDAKAIWAFRLKEKYQGLQNRQHLIQEMRVDTTTAIHNFIRSNQQILDDQQKMICQERYNNDQKNWLLPAGFTLGCAYMFFLMMQDKLNHKS